jgi:hypothetical protein
MRGPLGGARLALAYTSALAALLIGLTLSGLLLLAAAGPSPPRALAAPLDTPTATATASATATPQPTQAPQETLALISPSSGQGPVGANLTFAGTHWSGSQVSIAAATTGCASPAGILGQTAPKGNGSFTVTLAWPTSLASSGTAYLLCASSTAGPPLTAAQTYRVRSSSAPALALSLTQAGVGQEVQIQGSNFVGASQVSLEVQTRRGTRALPTIAPDPKDGSFATTYTPASADQGAVTITATSAPESSAPPALQANATLAVGPPLPPTPTVTPAPSEADGPGIIVTSSDENTIAPSVLLAVGALLGLLALAGMVAWLVLRPRPRRRAAPAPPPPGAWPVPRSNLWSSDPDPAPRSETARVPVGAAARSTGRVRAAPSAAPPESSVPPPDWQRRPMTGKFWSYADEAYHGAGNGNARPGSKLRNRYGDDSNHFGDDGGDPTLPGRHSYFGLPSLESVDSAATQPNGPSLPEAHE